MESLGTRLRKGRESRGMTLDELAQITKIPRSSLEKLEDDDLTGFPAEVYIKGFIRTFCQTVNIEVDHAYTRYYQQRQQRTTENVVMPEFPGFIVSESQEYRRGLQLSHLLLILTAIVTFLIAFVAFSGDKQKTELSSRDNHPAIRQVTDTASSAQIP